MLIITSEDAPEQYMTRFLQQYKRAKKIVDEESKELETVRSKLKLCCLDLTI